MPLVKGIAPMAGSSPPARIKSKGTSVIVGVSGRALLQSPGEGLWSVATNWGEGWPSGWNHVSPDKVEREGDLTIGKG